MPGYPCCCNSPEGHDCHGCNGGTAPYEAMVALALSNDACGECAGLSASYILTQFDLGSITNNCLWQYDFPVPICPNESGVGFQRLQLLIFRSLFGIVAQVNLGSILGSSYTVPFMNWRKIIAPGNILTTTNCNEITNSELDFLQMSESLCLPISCHITMPAP